MKNYLSPAEIAEYSEESGVKKANTSAVNLFVLGILAGAFIAFASEGSNMAAFTLFAKPDTYGLGKVVAGTIFGTGLMFVLIAGGELFTGNTLMSIALIRRKITLVQMLRNWLLVYVGNFVGSILIAVMMNYSGLFHTGDNMLGGITIKLAAYKLGLNFGQAFVLGIMCNWLVCLAVWLCYGAKDMSGKIWGVFFPIWLFITSGFEHSIANMYYISAGILAKSNPDLLAAAQSVGLDAEHAAELTWSNMFLHSLLPVTLGNIIGGSIFVGFAYWFVYMRGSKTKNNAHAFALKR